MATRSAATNLVMSGASPSFAGEGVGALPLIRREGIDWSGGVAGTPLRMRLRFENPGPLPSVPCRARVDAAPFGAFLPWQPLATVSVPAIPPGGRIVLTATAAGDRPEGRPASPPAAHVREGREFMMWIRRIAESERFAPDARADTDAGLEPVHFVGNLNVHLTRREPVERHQNRSVGLRSGSANVVIFFVGDGTKDRYSFRLDAEPDWDVRLADLPWGAPLTGTREIVLGAVRPPAGARHGRLAIWVTRHSTGEEVPVEFELANDARTLRCGEA